MSKCSFDSACCNVWHSLLLWCRIYGVTYIGLGSIGNYVTCRRWFVPLIGAAFAGFAVMSPFDAFGHGYTTYLSIMAVVLGLGVVVFHCLHALSLLVSKTWAQANPRWEHRLTTGSVKDANIKRAAAHKVNLMMRNAIDIAENKVRFCFLVLVSCRCVFALNQFLSEPARRCCVALWTRST